MTAIAHQAIQQCHLPLQIAQLVQQRNQTAHVCKAVQHPLTQVARLSCTQVMRQRHPVQHRLMATHLTAHMPPLITYLSVSNLTKLKKARSVLTVAGFFVRARNRGLCLRRA